MTLRRLAGAVALIVLALAPAAAAAPPAGRVRLLQSSAMSARARRCLTRLREELTPVEITELNVPIEDELTGSGC